MQHLRHGALRVLGIQVLESLETTCTGRHDNLVVPLLEQNVCEVYQSGDLNEADKHTES